MTLRIRKTDVATVYRPAYWGEESYIEREPWVSVEGSPQVFSARVGNYPHLERTVSGLEGTVLSTHIGPGIMPILISQIEKNLCHKALSRALKKVLPALNPPNKP